MPTGTSRPSPGPRDTASPRMGDLSKLPVFLDLVGRRAVLASEGGYGAAWKAELIAAAGARVEVFEPEPSPEMLALQADWPERVAVTPRAWGPDDLPGAAIAVGAVEDEKEAARFAAAARAAGVPVNVVDKPAFCDFQFGAVVNRSPLVIGISTDGGAPTLGQAVRARIEALLPLGLATWAAAAKGWRPRVQTVRPFAARRRFWQLFAERAIARPNDAPTEDLRESLLADAVAETARRGGMGSLVLVGAGPGDPELLTMKAVRVLQTADVVLYDDLVGPRVVELARREARKVHVGKRAGRPSCGQDEICALILSLVREGKRVVRLKGGDPMLFGRAGEEIAAAQAHSIPVEVVPGVSAAQGAAAKLLCSLTHRDHARRVQFVTGQDRTGGLAEGLNWHALSDPGATTVVYMPRRILPDLLRRILALGLPPDTPLAAIVNATRGDEEQVAISTIGRVAADPDVVSGLPDGPLIILYGSALAEVANLEAVAPDLEQAA